MSLLKCTRTSFLAIYSADVMVSNVKWTNKSTWPTVGGFCGQKATHVNMYTQLCTYAGCLWYICTHMHPGGRNSDAWIRELFSTLFPGDAAPDPKMRKGRRWGAGGNVAYLSSTQTLSGTPAEASESRSNCVICYPERCIRKWTRFPCSLTMIAGQLVCVCVCSNLKKTISLNYLVESSCNTVHLVTHVSLFFSFLNLLSFFPRCWTGCMKSILPK